MSLRPIEIKKHLEVVTKEYKTSLMLNRVWSALNGEIINFFIHSSSDMRSLLVGLSQELPKIMEVKGLQLWVRDILNNYLWTYSKDSEYQKIDLAKS